MSTQTSAPSTGHKRLKPHQLVIGIGCFIAAFTLVSGILPLFVEHTEKEVSRKVFGGIPGPLKAAFYTVVPAMLVWGAIVFAGRMKNWERGAPDRRRTTPKNVARRLADFRAGVYMRTLLRDAGAGLMHSMIYFGFLALLGVTTLLEVDHQLPDDLKFLHGTTYKAYAFFGDLAGLVFLTGIVWAIENPQAGIVETDEMDYQRCIGIQSGYLGKLTGVYTDWTPLDSHVNLFDTRVDLKDPWQFSNIIVR